MSAPPLVGRLVRALVRHYCRRIPVQRFKTQLMFHCHPLITPWSEVVLLNWGGRIQTDLSDNIQRQIYFQGHYEPKITRLISQALAPGDTFMDIGANIGYYTILASLIVGPSGSVHSFEPLPEIFSQLKRNLTLNGVANVHANQMALFQEEAEVELYLPDPGNNGSGSLVHRPHHPGESIRCSAVTLDGYVQRQGIDRVRLIKMDIEGGEFFALRGMQEVLSRNRRRNLSAR